MLKSVALHMSYRLGADVQEFQSLYQENLGPIYRFVYSKVRNREEAEDLTSHVFLKAVRSLDLERGAQYANMAVPGCAYNDCRLLALSL